MEESWTWGLGLHLLQMTKAAAYRPQAHTRPDHEHLAQGQPAPQSVRFPGDNVLRQM